MRRLVLVITLLLAVPGCTTAPCLHWSSTSVVVKDSTDTVVGFQTEQVCTEER